MKNIQFTFVITFVTLLLTLFSCNQETQKKEKPKPNKESFIDANKSIVNEEINMISNYIKRHGYTNVIRKKGVYIINLKKGLNTIVNRKDIIRITYKVSLINGTIVEEQKTPQTIVVGKNGNVAMGIHYALEGMRLGSKSIVILPSHMAYGLAGNEIIPPKATLIYEIEILKN